MEEILKQGGVQFRALVERAASAIFILQGKKFCYANAATVAMSGYSHAELLTMNCWDIIHPDFQATVKAHYEEVKCQQEYPCDRPVLEVKFATKSGEERWAEVTSTVFDLANVPAILGIAFDITARKQAEAALCLSEEKFSKAFRASPDAITINTVVDGRYIEVNDGFLRATGYARQEVIGRTTIELGNWVNPADRDLMHRMLQQDFWVRDLEVAFRIKSGEVRVGLVSAELIHLGGELCLLAVVRDITERKRVEEALRVSEEKFSKAFRSSPDSITISTLTDGRVIEVNDSFLRITGYTREEVTNRTAAELNIWAKPTERILMEQMLQQQGEVLNLEASFCVKSGEVRTGLVSAEVIQLAGEPCLLIVIRDITDRKQADAQLLRSALYDHLTGLPNRALFMDRLRYALNHARRDDTYLFAILFLDVDRFKVVNDSLGHMMGDQLLIAIAARLEAAIRPGDTVARLGGDEFTILLDDIKVASDAIDVAERIHQKLQQPFNLSGHEVFTSASIGITLNQLYDLQKSRAQPINHHFNPASPKGVGSDILALRQYEQPEDLLRDADIAMYRAKALGKARHEVFDTSMRVQAVSLLQMEMDLRRAIERQEFRVHYQPIVLLKTGEITGFEALVRWQHPKRGLISPTAFIPVAEETGLIVPIGWWVLQEACQQMRSWQLAYAHLLQESTSALTISVNLSGKQFLQPDLLPQINRVLQETGLDTSSLKLEITESVIIEHTESITAILLELRAQGIQLYIDDFGTGYSSLSRLHQFPINRLKIDRSFVSRMHPNGNHNLQGDALEATPIVRTIITLADNLGMNVTAEGVETAQQLAQLKALGCECGQGYFFSRPIESNRVDAMLAASKYLPLG
ncbi:diguanylate cyclase/phosphodiesterase (GGDEF & EAL domains) with PAS/PAC sensor(s) [uncultured Synechococcales cyanobacterium]|uniref:Diguanylate cyclase/phosphodiesterase (GGDEF & EAL domains) with PAS/PAC sensor(S) n=1 Tax=uncultured Synechococcales cyanobacterium TaxID=1936017 RepID=A0A6J4V932_9CYAN|nr:diguanylate cyclase/phosphodiesterase (GGDEF & EAL domains) with PAS/PAC sensor(s) [uncultured Synechococcales cyanobacterium]